MLAKKPFNQIYQGEERQARGPHPRNHEKNSIQEIKIFLKEIRPGVESWFYFDSKGINDEISLGVSIFVTRYKSAASGSSSYQRSLLGLIFVSVVSAILPFQDEDHYGSRPHTFFGFPRLNSEMSPEWVRSE